MAEALEVAQPRARALDRAERPLPAMKMADEFLSQLQAQLSEEVRIPPSAACSSFEKHVERHEPKSMTSVPRPESR
jgi:hypothetical protein